ncbi:hypothetical protein ACH4SK_36510 [Streptomyces inhibens]|uniref:hypothetical protein n=1 Tax=Streptomyces inhibens TaxID=2293571 RepID=UPI0037BDEE29
MSAIELVCRGMRPGSSTEYDLLACIRHNTLTCEHHHSALDNARPPRRAAARLAEGGDVVGRRVLVVEDVVTSGGQIVLSSIELRALGADIREALCVIDRQQGSAEALAAEGIGLLSLRMS